MTRSGMIVIVALWASSARADLSYYIWDTWGGTWADAEKTIASTEDDQLCWAAASANVLEYTRWGKVGGMTTTDDIFGHFQNHFTDAPGNSYYAYDWWWDGTNGVQGLPGWAQEDVDGGGGFYPGLNINDYRRWTGNRSGALSTLDKWLHDGYASAVLISGGMSHTITAWGFTYDSSDPHYYTGLWVTDSDDDYTNPPYPDSLRYYDLVYSNSAWYLSGGYFGYGATNYISEVSGLQVHAVPVPGAFLLGAMGLSMAAVRLRHRKA